MITKEEKRVLKVPSIFWKVLYGTTIIGNIMKEKETT